MRAAFLLTAGEVEIDVIQVLLPETQPNNQFSSLFSEETGRLLSMAVTNSLLNIATLDGRQGAYLKLK